MDLVAFAMSDYSVFQDLKRPRIAAMLIVSTHQMTTEISYRNWLA